MLKKNKKQKQHKPTVFHKSDFPNKSRTMEWDIRVNVTFTEVKVLIPFQGQTILLSLLHQIPSSRV